MKSSGASNRSRQRQAEADRNAEADAETKKLADMSEEDAAQLRQLFDLLLWGALDPVRQEDPEAPDDGD